MTNTKALVNGQFTNAARKIYLAILENREFDLYYCRIDDKPFCHLNIEQWW